jgi:hypothetical protein
LRRFGGGGGGGGEGGSSIFVGLKMLEVLNLLNMPVFQLSAKDLAGMVALTTVMVRCPNLEP